MDTAAFAILAMFQACLDKDHVIWRTEEENVNNIILNMKQLNKRIEIRRKKEKILN